MLISISLFFTYYFTCFTWFTYFKSHYSVGFYNFKLFRLVYLLHFSFILFVSLISLISLISLFFTYFTYFTFSLVHLSIFHSFTVSECHFSQSFTVLNFTVHFFTWRILAPEALFSFGPNISQQNKVSKWQLLDR